MNAIEELTLPANWWAHELKTTLWLERETLRVYQSMAAEAEQKGKPAPIAPLRLLVQVQRTRMQLSGIAEVLRLAKVPKRSAPTHTPPAAPAAAAPRISLPNNPGGIDLLTQIEALQTEVSRRMAELANFPWEYDDEDPDTTDEPDAPTPQPTQSLTDGHLGVPTVPHSPAPYLNRAQRRAQERMQKKQRARKR